MKSCVIFLSFTCLALT